MALAVVSRKGISIPRTVFLSPLLLAVLLLKGISIVFSIFCTLLQKVCCTFSQTVLLLLWCCSEKCFEFMALERIAVTFAVVISSLFLLYVLECISFVSLASLCLLQRFLLSLLLQAKIFFHSPIVCMLFAAMVHFSCLVFLLQ
jgi:hypothetical protein